MNGALRSILSRTQRVEIDVAGVAQGLRIAEFAGCRIGKVADMAAAIDKRAPFGESGARSLHAGSALTASGARPRRRICVIGNSSVGAVRIALGDRGAPGAYEFAFFASDGPKFDRVVLDGDCVAGFEVNSGGDRDLRGYDAFVLQGRLPTACAALAFG